MRWLSRWSASGLMLHGALRWLGGALFAATLCGCAEPGATPDEEHHLEARTRSGVNRRALEPSLLNHRFVTKKVEVLADHETRRAAPLVWGGEQRLVANDAAELDQFGYAVSLSNDRALVGAYGENSYAGAAYVFVKADGSWVEEQKLVPSDQEPGDYFGWSVALDANRALVGSYARDFYRGAVYVFVRDGDSWVEEQKLLASERAEFDRFGVSVSLSNERALIGAYGADESRGAAYVFSNEGGAWREEQKLVASGGVAQDGLGYSVSLAADRAVLGAPGKDSYSGAAHVFVRSGQAWSEEQALVASDRAEFDQFGASVSLAGDRALIGAYWDDEFRGTARVFVRSRSSWTEEQELVANERAVGDRFGNAVSLSADMALIGAFGADASRGTAEVFTRTGGSWNFVQELAASDGEASDLFGWSVALAPGQALIGANYADQTRGAAYFFSLGVGNGRACSVNSECASGHCVDEVCCDVECAGACSACSLETGAVFDGTCTVFPEGFEGKTPCAPLACNGQSPDCAPCQADADCPEARYCAGERTCQPRRRTGETCGERAGEDCLLDGCRQCESGFCSDGVCCNVACEGVCEACAARLTLNRRDGECGPIAAETDPDGECSDDGLPACGKNGLCDGTGACQSYASPIGCEPEACESGDECRSGHCEDGICCDRTCSASERCRASLKVAGPDGVCGPARAAALGAACQFDVQCTSGHCSASSPPPECALGSSCARSGECVGESGEVDAPSQGSGCGCRSTRAGSTSGWLSLVVVALLALGRRRRQAEG